MGRQLSFFLKKAQKKKRKKKEGLMRMYA